MAFILTSGDTFKNKENETFVWERCSNCKRFGRLNSFDAHFLASAIEKGRRFKRIAGN